MMRAIRFLRQWEGKTGQNDVRDAGLSNGQRELLVTRGIAEYVDEPKPAPLSVEARRGKHKDTQPKQGTSSDMQH